MTDRPRRPRRDPDGSAALARGASPLRPLLRGLLGLLLLSALWVPSSLSPRAALFAPTAEAASALLSPHPTLDPQHLAEAIAGALESSDRDPYWVAARETTYRKTAELLSQDRAERGRGAQGDKVFRGDPERRWICLTFDDGPHPNTTPRLLSILRRENIRATFFVVGMMGELFPELLREEAAEGHAVGNHTYHHVNLTKIPLPYVATEIAACDRVLRKILGGHGHLFRPPGGDYDDRIVQIASALGYTTVLWTDDPGDYAHPGSLVLQLRFYGRLSNGGIILLHDGVEETVRMLPSLIEALKRKGYEFVTPDEMFGLRRDPCSS